MEGLRVSHRNPSRSRPTIPTQHLPSGAARLLRPILQGLLYGVGLVIIGIASSHIAFGPLATPGSVPVTPAMDSEDRFYATLFFAFGAAFIWCGMAIERRIRVLQVLLAVFFLGACARLISMLAVGLPNAFFQGVTILELVLPPFLWVLARQVEIQAKHEALVERLR